MARGDSLIHENGVPVLYTDTLFVVFHVGVGSQAGCYWCQRTREQVWPGRLLRTLNCRPPLLRKHAEQLGSLAPSPDVVVD